MPRSLKSLNDEVKERETYLRQVEGEITTALENGAMAIRDMKIEMDGLDRDKAKLMKELLTIRQEISEAKIAKSLL